MEMRRLNFSIYHPSSGIGLGDIGGTTYKPLKMLECQLSVRKRKCCNWLMVMSDYEFIIAKRSHAHYPSLSLDTAMPAASVCTINPYSIVWTVWHTDNSFFNEHI
jgi:hypothetical protein